MTISAIIHTKNSANTLRACLDSIQWVDEIIVVDAQSQDNSKKIASDYTSKIYDFKDISYVELARNFGISKATSDWIFILDADEVIPETLQVKLKELTTADKDAWKLPRKNLMFGEWIQHAGWWPDFNVRFFKHGVVDWPTKIHSQPRVTGSIGTASPEEKYAIIHHNYQSVADFVTRMNNYTTITIDEGTKVDDTAFVAFFNEFVRRFFAFEGYKDHSLGLHMSLLQGFYQALASIKQWEKLGKKQTKVSPEILLSKVIKDMNYWRADYMVKKTNSIWWKLRRKLYI